MMESEGSSSTLGVVDRKSRRSGETRPRKMITRRIRFTAVRSHRLGLRPPDKIL
jgi:hypothetical protein